MGWSGRALRRKDIKFCVPEAEVSLYVCGTAWQVEVTIGCEVEVVPLASLLIWVTG